MFFHITLDENNRVIGTSYLKSIIDDDPRTIYFEEEPLELKEVPAGHICVYENGVFSYEKLPDLPKSNLEILQEEVAELWYDNMLKDMKIGTLEQEVATLWYELMVGGMSK